MTTAPTGRPSGLPERLPLGLRAASSAGRLAAAASDLGGRRLSILLYHRVLPEPDPLFPGEVDARRFDAQMAMVARSFNVLGLAEAAARLANGSLPPRALVITFDDGYADNHDVALPILQRHGLGACFFVATGFLDGGRMWNDTVIECVRRSPLSSLDLGEFELGRVEIGSAVQRRAAIDRLIAAIKYRNFEGRAQALSRLSLLCQAGPLADDLMMSSAKVRALHAAGQEVGAHTVHHPILCALPDADAEQEMATGRDRLQALIDAPVTLFAYPNGRPDQDYAARHAAMARRLGFSAAVSTAAGVSRAGDDPFQLPRFTPWDRTPARWLARLLVRRGQTGFAQAAPVPPVPQAAVNPPRTGADASAH